jgi:hypothetical protein
MAFLQRIYTATIASFATSVNKDLGKPYQSVFLQIPSLTSNSALAIMGSIDGTTYRKLNLYTNSSTLQFPSFVIPSTATNTMVQLPGGFRYMRIDCTAILSATNDFHFICYDGS